MCDSYTVGKMYMLQVLSLNQHFWKYNVVNLLVLIKICLDINYTTYHIASVYTLHVYTLQTINYNIYMYYVNCNFSKWIFMFGRQCIGI